VPDAFAILADPTRRRLVEALHAGERSVNDLVEAVAIAQPGVSRHLRILHEGGFVTARADGQRRLYSLRPQPLREMEAWMRRHAHAESDRLGRLASFVEGEAAAGKAKPSKPSRKTKT
jgi:DNA-binding transcriptional ArsR family regulator